MQIKKQQLEPRHGTMDWFQIGKGVCQGVYCHPAYYYPSMQSTSCEMPGWIPQAGIKISRRIINNFRYADDITLMAEREEELKRLLMKVKRVKKLA